MTPRRTSLPVVFGLALLTLVMPAPVSSQVVPPSVEALAWMAGCWEGTLESGSLYEESWSAPRGGMLLGTARTIRDGRAVSWEFMRIAEEAGTLVYVAKPSGQASTAFRLAELGEDAVSFGNPAHDFPQWIRYEQPAPGRLLARIEGEIEGAARGIEFPLARVACPGGAGTRGGGPLRVPRFDGTLGIGKRPEPMHVQAVVPNRTVEALDEAVLHRLSGLDEVDLHPSGIGPGIERSASELGAIVGNDGFGKPSFFPESFQNFDHTLRRNRMRDVDGQALSSEFVQDLEAPKALTGAERVGHEVHGPSLVRSDQRGADHARSLAPSLLPLSTHGEPFFPVDPLDPFPVHGPSFPTE